MFNPSDPSTESKLITALEQLNTGIESSPVSINYLNPHPLTYIKTILNYPLSEAVILKTLKCVSTIIRINLSNCYQTLSSGIFQNIYYYINPQKSDTKRTLKLAIEARHIFYQTAQYDQFVVEAGPTFYKFKNFFIDIYEFPLSEQRLTVDFVYKVSNMFANDYFSVSLIQICPLLTHFDNQIVSKSIEIIYNVVHKGNTEQLKIVDPLVARSLALTLEVITDDQLIYIVLNILEKLCHVSYEFAENLVELPIDFELIIGHLSVDPREDVVYHILLIIKQIFSFRTLRRKSDKISMFAFYVQPLLIRFVCQNIGDLNLALECLSTTLDVHVPLQQMNNILDAAIHYLSSGNKKKDSIEIFYKKLIGNDRIKEAIIQYESLNLPKTSQIQHLTDINSLMTIGNLHSSSFLLNESLQHSILKLFESIRNSSSIIQYKDVILNIVDVCHKMIIYNVPKEKQKYGQELLNEFQPVLLNFLIYDQTGKTVNLQLPEIMNLSFCETAFNFTDSFQHFQQSFSTLSDSAIEQSRINVLLSQLDNLIDITSLDNDEKTSLINHLLCLRGNRLLQLAYNFGDINLPFGNVSSIIKNKLRPFKFYYIKAQGKIYSVFDQLQHIYDQTKVDQFEMVEIPMNIGKLTKLDFLNRPDISQSDCDSELSEVNFDAFHQSFIAAFPTLFLQRRSFDYFEKASIPVIDTSLRILKEIHRIFPDLKRSSRDTNHNKQGIKENDQSINNNENDQSVNNKGNEKAGNENNDDNENDYLNNSDFVDEFDFKNAFENDIFAWRMLEIFDYKSLSNPITTSAFINYPFMFPLETRLLFLKLTSMSRIHCIFTMVDEIYTKSHKVFEPFQRMKLIVDRNRIFEDGLNIFNLLAAGNISFNISFRNENGVGSGPTHEFFSLFAEELQRNTLDIWLTDNPNKTNTKNDTNKTNTEKETNFKEFAYRKGESGLFPSPLAVRRPDLFFTLGSLCAKAIEMGIVLPLHFSPAFFKLIRNEHIELEEVSNQYSGVLKQDHEGLIGLPFTVPGREDIELRDGGSFLNTDEENVEMYVELLRRVLTFDVHIDHSNINESSEKVSVLTPKSSGAWKSLQRTLSTTGISCQDNSSTNSENQLNEQTSTNSNEDERDTENNENEVNDTEEEKEFIIPSEIEMYIKRYNFECCGAMFREGFGRVIPWSGMNIFTAEEMCLILEGEDDFSLETLRNFVDIGSGFDSNSPTIVWLFEVISKEMSREEKKLLTRFITGSDNFGIFGLKSLNPRLNISKKEKNDFLLPSASTCTNCLKLPEYSSKEILKRKLLYAIYECQKSFDLT